MLNYMLIEFHPNPLEGICRIMPGQEWTPLAELGKEGWEIVAIWYAGGMCGAPTYALLKRVETER